MAWNLLKKRRENLEKDKAEQESKYTNPIGKPEDFEPGPKKMTNPIGDPKDFEPGPKIMQNVSSSNEPSLSVKAQQRGLDIRNAQKDNEDAAISGPFPGGGRKKGTSSGAFPFSLFGESRGKATSPPSPTPTPTPTADELEDHHRRQAEKYKPGNQSLPATGTPNLSEEEKKELDKEINMQPRQ